MYKARILNNTALPWQQWLHKSASVMYVHCLNMNAFLLEIGFVSEYRH